MKVHHLHLGWHWHNPGNYDRIRFEFWLGWCLRKTKTPTVNVGFSFLFWGGYGVATWIP